MTSFCCKRMNAYAEKNRKRRRFELGFTGDVDNIIGMSWETRLWLNLKNPQRETPCRLESDIKDRLKKGQSVGLLLKGLRQGLDTQ